MRLHITEYNIGDKVHYQPEHFRDDQRQNGGYQ